MPSKSLKKNHIFYIILSLVVIFEIAVSFYLPLLPEIRHFLNVSEYLIQLSVGSYLLGLGFSAIIFGGLSDILGRRKMLIISLTVFTLSAYLCSTTNSIELLILFRFLQGAGGGAGWPLGNAILRDIFDDKKFSQAIISMHAVSGIVPLFAIICGGYIGDLLGWRASFIILFSLSFVTLVVVLILLPETKLDRKNISISSILNNYLTLLYSKKYWKYLLVKVLMVAVLFVYIANIPLIYVESCGCTTIQASYYMVIGTITYVIGNFVCKKLIINYSQHNIINIGLCLVLLSSLLMLLGNKLYPNQAMPVALSTIFTSLGLSFIFGNATYFVVGSHPNLAGSGAAVMIALEMLTSALMINIVGYFYDGTVMPMAIFIFLSVIVSLLSSKFFVIFSLINTIFRSKI
jgi:DHA1 family bicyclomycin/chloramphenicol resistance-like MFS transporter